MLGGDSKQTPHVECLLDTHALKKVKQRRGDSWDGGGLLQIASSESLTKMVIFEGDLKQVGLPALGVAGKSVPGREKNRRTGSAV